MTPNMYAMYDNIWRLLLWLPLIVEKTTTTNKIGGTTISGGDILVNRQVNKRSYKKSIQKGCLYQLNADLY